MPTELYDNTKVNRGSFLLPKSVLQVTPNLCSRLIYALGLVLRRVHIGMRQLVSAGGAFAKFSANAVRAAWPPAETSCLTPTWTPL